MNKFKKVGLKCLWVRHSICSFLPQANNYSTVALQLFLRVLVPFSKWKKQ